MRLSAYSVNNTSKKNHYFQGGGVCAISFWGAEFYRHIVDLQHFVLVSGIYQSESVLYIYTYTHTHTHTHTHIYIHI